jgi:hypothetical protein
MPFKEMSIVMQREEFCRLALSLGANVRELCRRVGISPPDPPCYGRRGLFWGEDAAQNNRYGSMGPDSPSL